MSEDITRTELDTVDSPRSYRRRLRRRDQPVHSIRRESAGFVPADRCEPEPRPADDRTADLLERFSSAARKSTGYATSATALEWAAELSPTGRARRLYLAAADAQLAGHRRYARALLLRADAADAGTDGACRCATADALDLHRALRLVGDGHHSAARRTLADTAAELRRSGAIRALPPVLAAQAVAEAGAGHLVVAESTAGMAIDLAELTGDDNARLSGLCTLALVHAIRGDEQHFLPREAQALALTGGDRQRTHRVARARAILELGLGRYAALAAGSSVADPSLGDRLEALIRLGRPIDSLDLELLHDAVRTGLPPVAAASLRVLGLAAPQHAYPDHFLQALALYARMDAPFDQARTRLAYGQRLRRDRQRMNARRQLRLARDAFARMGATLWATLADNELSATSEGGTPPPQDPVQALLTPQEYQVARSVSNGLTNREAAVQLFLSVKTIEFHLGKVYRKLEVRSRTQLVQYLASAARAAEAE